MGNVAVHGVEQWERRDGFELMARQGNEERERERERERGRAAAAAAATVAATAQQHSRRKIDACEL